MLDHGQSEIVGVRERGGLNVHHEHGARHSKMRKVSNKAKVELGLDSVPSSGKGKERERVHEVRRSLTNTASVSSTYSTSATSSSLGVSSTISPSTSMVPSATPSAHQLMSITTISTTSTAEPLYQTSTLYFQSITSTSSSQVAPSSSKIVTVLINPEVGNSRKQSLLVTSVINALASEVQIAVMVESRNALTVTPTPSFSRPPPSITPSLISRTSPTFAAESPFSTGLPLNTVFMATSSVESTPTSAEAVGPGPAIVTLTSNTPDIPFTVITPATMITSTSVSSSSSAVPSSFSSSSSIPTASTSSASTSAKSLIPVTSTTATSSVIAPTASDTNSAPTTQELLIRIVPATLVSVFVAGLLILFLLLCLRRRRKAVRTAPPRPPRPPGDFGSPQQDFNQFHDVDLGTAAVGSRETGMMQEVRRDEIRRDHYESRDEIGIASGSPTQDILDAGDEAADFPMLLEPKTPWGRRSLRAVLGRGGRGAAAIHGTRSNGGRARSMERYQFEGSHSGLEEVGEEIHSDASSLNRGVGGYNSNITRNRSIYPAYDVYDPPHSPLPPLPAASPSVNSSIQLSSPSRVPSPIVNWDNSLSTYPLLPPALIPLPAEDEFDEPHRDPFYGTFNPGIIRSRSRPPPSDSSWTIDRENSDLLARLQKVPSLPESDSSGADDEFVMSEEETDEQRVDFGSSSESGRGLGSIGDPSVRSGHNSQRESGSSAGVEAVLEEGAKKMREDGSWW